jgi:hypothetical protein
MKCNECKWFVGTANDTYGLCKRYPTTQNKTQHDWCGDFTELELKIKFIEPTEYEAPKRGRRPKNAN